MNIFVLTGDGLAVESGLRSFRDQNGTWERFSPYHEEGRKGFAQASLAQRRYYDARKIEAAQATPNAAHRALAELEQQFSASGYSVFLATQCLDDLHEQAGSCCPLHIIGEYRKAKCWVCKAVFPCDGSLEANPGCPVCGHIDSTMPAVNWLGSKQLDTKDIDGALATMDLFVAIGTSASFQPPNSLIRTAWHRGIRTLEFNTDGSATSGLFHERRLGRALETVPAWTVQLIADVQNF